MTRSKCCTASDPGKTVLAPILSILLVFLVPAGAPGAGFSIYEQGGKGLGAAGAFTARVDDASGIFFNPAGLARIEGGSVVLGSSWIYVTREFAGTDPFPGRGVLETSPRQSYFPPHAFWGHRASETLAVGFGAYVPFGLNTEWKNPEIFSGRFISTRATLVPFFFNPVVAVSLTPRIRVGAGVMAVHSTIELDRNVGQPNPLGDPGVLDLGTLELDGDNGLDFGFNVGAQLDAGDRVSLGINYRSSVKLSFEGDTDFTYIGVGTLDPQLQPLFPVDQSGSTELELPDLLVMGLGARVGETGFVEGNLGWTRWSTFDDLTIRFEDESLTTTLIQNWEDAWFFRVGGGMNVKPGIQVRVGYYYDETPQPTVAVSPILPGNSRHGLTAGIGKTWDRWSLDGFGLLLIIPDRDTGGINRYGFEGIYANGIHILGASLSYRY